ncbi:MAG: hypothetical protein WBB29_18300 [Geitlerinemataceae cyanobacterium]
MSIELKSSKSTRPSKIEIEVKDLAVSTENTAPEAKGAFDGDDGSD